MSELRVYTESGPDGYPPEWHEIKHQVRNDAGNRCVRCQHPYRKGEGEWSECDDRCRHEGPLQARFECHHEWQTVEHRRRGHFHRARWRILTVHHLNGNKLDCRWWNLAALCQRCHLTIQGKVVMERRFLGEHSAWFKPYVAGFYAFDRLGEDLTRAEVDRRLDELLALEDRQLVLAAREPAPSQGEGGA